MKICYRCQRRYKDEFVYCPGCGEDLVLDGQDRQCPSCWGIVSQKYIYCPYCGYSLQRDRRGKSHIRPATQLLPVKMVRGIGEDTVKMFSLNREKQQIEVFPDKREKMQDTAAMLPLDTTGGKRADAADSAVTVEGAEEKRIFPEGMSEVAELEQESDLGLLMRKLGVMMTLAEKGDVDAQCTLAMAYYEGQYVEKNKLLSRYWFEQAAVRGDVYALTMLKALDFSAGDFSEETGGKVTMETLLAAAQSGDAEAQYRLGEACLEQGEAAYNLVVYWLARSAEQGNRDAMLELAVCYMQGYGLQQDAATGFRMFEALAKQGLALAQTCLATCYYRGQGTAPDMKQAAYWLRKAAEQGDRKAKELLARWFGEQ